MNVYEFIKNIINTRKSASYYFLQKCEFPDVENGLAESTETIPKVYFDRNEAYAAFKEEVKNTEAYFGVYVGVYLAEVVVNPEDFDNEDILEEVETYNETLDDKDLLANTLIENEENIIENEYVYYDYKPLEGSILVFWQWHRHVGYSRTCKSIEYAGYNDTEKMCIEEDRVCQTFCSVLCSKKELAGLSKKEVKKLVNNKLNLAYWKWNNNPHTIAKICDFE
jgi:hypothetical protein